MTPSHVIPSDLAPSDLAPSGPATDWPAVLGGAGLVPAFQPIVDLRSMSVVAYEALARWPGQQGLTPDRVFAVAAEHGATAGLDRACLTAALSTAATAGLPRSTALFVNVEPATVTGDDLATVTALTTTADTLGLSVVVELTERHLLRAPADLLRAVHAARAAGLQVALDDVGAHPDSLALLDLVMPDVIKLDLALVQQSPTRDQARTLAAVMAHCERTGTPVLAEGIEDHGHLEQALACGATLGQGWMLGRPGALPAFPPGHPPARTAARRDHPLTPATPADLLGEQLPVRVGAKRWLTALSRHIEAQAHNDVDPPVLLTSFQAAEHFVAATRERYGRLSLSSPLVAAFARDMPAVPVGAVRGVALTADDPLLQEWTVVALGAQTAAALIARDLGDGGPDAERRFAFAVTYDRRTVTLAARSLVARLTGRPTPDLVDGAVPV